jgi:hypothetical protein
MHRAKGDKTLVIFVGFKCKGIYLIYLTLVSNGVKNDCTVDVVAIQQFGQATCRSVEYNWQLCR